MAGLSSIMAHPQKSQYPSELCSTPYSPTLRERLLNQKADLTQRLADVDSALTALDDNPNFENVLNVIGKVQY